MYVNNNFVNDVFQEMHAQVQDVGEDLEQVEVMQKKFDDFQNDLRANEVRLAEMNEIAVQLMTVGQTEAALKIKTQMQVRWKIITFNSTEFTLFYDLIWFSVFSLILLSIASKILKFCVRFLNIS